MTHLLLLVTVMVAFCLSSTVGHPISKRAVFYIANETVCLVDGEVFHNGDPVPSDNPCEFCKCRPPGFACVYRSCEAKPGCKAVRREKACCPDYICGCTLRGRYYEDGDPVEDPDNPCYSCRCQEGTIACAHVDCPFHPGCLPRQTDGACCPTYTHCENGTGVKPYFVEEEFPSQGDEPEERNPPFILTDATAAPSTPELEHPDLQTTSVDPQTSDQPASSTSGTYTESTVAARSTTKTSPTGSSLSDRTAVTGVGLTSDAVRSQTLSTLILLESTRSTYTISTSSPDAALSTSQTSTTLSVSSESTTPQTSSPATSLSTGSSEQSTRTSTTPQTSSPATSLSTGPSEPGTRTSTTSDETSFHDVTTEGSTAIWYQQPITTFQPKSETDPTSQSTDSDLLTTISTNAATISPKNDVTQDPTITTFWPQLYANVTLTVSNDNPTPKETTKQEMITLKIEDATKKQPVLFTESHEILEKPSREETKNDVKQRSTKIEPDEVTNPPYTEDTMKNASLYDSSVAPDARKTSNDETKQHRQDETSPNIIEPSTTDKVEISTERASTPAIFYTTNKIKNDRKDEEFATTTSTFPVYFSPVTHLDNVDVGTSSTTTSSKE